jgi:hypothetical protein
MQRPTRTPPFFATPWPAFPTILDVFSFFIACVPFFTQPRKPFAAQFLHFRVFFHQSSVEAAFLLFVSPPTRHTPRFFAPAPPGRALGPL